MASTTVQISPDAGKAEAGINYTKAPAIAVQFQQINYSVTTGNRRNKKEKPILKGVSGLLRPGRLTAIMGSSGAGKTTLLNILSGRLTGAVAGSKLDGKLLLNGVELNNREEVKEHSAYVMQEDVFFATLTPFELLLFSAKLRLPQEMPESEKVERVEAVLKELGLSGVRNTPIGGVSVKGRGLSGGEKKRLSIGVELITNPSILFLDEPTTGLDSLTAFHVIDTVRGMAHKGNRTVICTIHQPSSEIFELFDDLILMVNGHLIYHGEAADAVKYFAKQNYPCPEYSNPADFFMMEIMHFDPQNKADQDRIEPLVKANLETQANHSDDSKTVEGFGQALPHKDKHERSNMWTETKLLFWRSTVHFLRQPMTTKLRLGQNIFMSLLIGLLYLRIGNNQSTIGDRRGALFIIMMNNFMTSFSPAMITFSTEKLVVMREQANRMYSPALYFIGKLFSELPFQMIFPFIYSSISYWLVGFQSDAERFVKYLVMLLVLVLTGQGFGLMVAAIAPTPEVAFSFMPIIMIPFIIFSGLFIDINSIPVWLRWISWVSPFKYTFRYLMTNEFDGLAFTCTSTEYVKAGPKMICPVTLGNQILASLDYSTDEYSFNLGITGAIAAGTTLIAFIVLVAKSRKAA